MSFRCELHAVYGSVLRDGDSVTEGDVLGLSADGKILVTAPSSGIVRLTQEDDEKSPRLYAEIVPSRTNEMEAGEAPAPVRQSA